jgi:DNA polymerase-1
VEIKNVTDSQRRAAKTANFAIIYGVSAYGLSQQSELSVAESKEFIDIYFERYPGIKKYMDDMIAMAREKGYVSTGSSPNGSPLIHLYREARRI